MAILHFVINYLYACLLREAHLQAMSFVQPRQKIELTGITMTVVVTGITVTVDCECNCSSTGSVAG